MMKYVVTALMSVAMLVDITPLGADIYRWDNGELIPGTEHVSAAPGVDLSNLDLSYANLRDVDLTNAELSHSNLALAHFGLSQLAGADLTDVHLTGAYLSHVDGFTADQLYSTANYKASNLSEITFSGVDLSGWDFSGQDLRNSNLAGTNLTDTLIANARIEGSLIGETTGLVPDQIYSTASYKQKQMQAIRFGTESTFAEWNFREQDLSFADFGGVDVSRTTFAGANLTQTNFRFATLSGTDFTDTIIDGADLAAATRRGFVASQLYSTRSYAQRNLRGVNLAGNDLRSWDFSNQDLTNAQLGLILADANFAGALIAGATLGGVTLEGIAFDQIRSTRSYEEGNLQGIDVEYLSLFDWNLRGQNLAGAVFGHTPTDCCDDPPSIRNVDFSGATLNNAWIQRFDEQTSDFSTVTLSGANLSSANLSTANLLFGAVFDSGTIYNQWTTFPRDFNPVAEGLTFIRTPDGDFDGDGELTIKDLTLLMATDGSGEASGRYDVNDDMRIDKQDVNVWIHDLKRTSFGDANLDGEFNSVDLVAVFAAGEYEDWGFGNSTWESGDWNGDREFTSSDLILALADGGYEQELAAAVSTVPEPSASVLVMAAVAFGAACGRRRAKTRRP